MRHVTVLDALSAAALAVLSTTAIACSSDGAIEADQTMSSESAVVTQQQIASDENGNFYVLTVDGDLLWYRETMSTTGARGWLRGSANRIGVGWGDTTKLISGGKGHLYRIKGNGELLWYGDEAMNGNVAWSPTSGGQPIGWGWQGFRLVFSGGGGSLYAVNAKGQLWWYKHSGRTKGTPEWSNGAGELLDSGWDDVKNAFTCQDNNLYAVRNNGDLIWYGDVEQSGKQLWKRNSGTVIGTGWQGFRHVWCGGKGNIYAVNSAGQMFIYRDVKQNGVSNPWSADSGVGIIGTGWSELHAWDTTEYRKCSSENDCPTHQGCFAGWCRVRGNSKWCEEGTNIARNAMGDREDCGSFACRDGACLRSCNTGAECGPDPCVAETHECGVAEYIDATLTVHVKGTSPQPSALPLRETITAHGCSTTCTGGDTCVRTACYKQLASRCSADGDKSIQYGTAYDCGKNSCDPVTGQCFGECFNAVECSYATCDAASRSCQ